MDNDTSSVEIPGGTLLLILLLGLTGCLPSSCNRSESRALFPADSLSRQLATQLPVDTLQAVSQTTGNEDRSLEYPRTVGYGPNEQIYVADTGHNSLFVFEADGTFSHEITHDDFSYPYLTGFRGDTVLVFNPIAHRIDFVWHGEIVGTLSTPSDLPKNRALQYTVANDEAVYFKALGESFEGYLAQLDDDGTLRERTPLPGAHWRHAGLLRFWGDSLLSLSGFRPVVDVLVPGEALDTLNLTGFDSPMLPRSRLFMLGEADDAPLLSASSAPAGDLLFVLNMRPGWLRIDAYDHSGMLRYILTQPDPVFNKEYYPTDLAVRQVEPGTFEFAILLLKPAPRLDRYRWKQP